jgi:acyl dehydratase
MDSAGAEGRTSCGQPHMQTEGPERRATLGLAGKRRGHHIGPRMSARNDAHALGRVIAMTDHVPPPNVHIASRQFGEAEVALYGDLSEDHNPIHSDIEFAAKTPFGYPIVYGFLFVMPIWAALEKAFGADAIATTGVTIRFISPLLVGRFAHYSTRVVEEEQSLTYEFTITSDESNKIALVTIAFPR